MYLVYDPIYGDHLRGVPHPESPDRVEVVAAALRGRGDFARYALAARDATSEEIERVHAAGYVARVRDEIASMRGHAGYLSTGDTVVDEGSLAVALRAAGGAIVAATTAADRNDASFALVRPPGHHAEPARGMGFCIFNNAAIAARAVQAQHGLRTLVVDFDYHHGNGTQAATGGGLSYLSTHGFPAYPGTGGPAENERLARGDAILNVPLPTHALGTEAFIAVWQHVLPRAIALVKPQMLIVSAGFDYVSGDPVGDLGVDVNAAAHLAALLQAAAREHCDGRIAYVLEGGYDTAAIARSVEQIVDVHSGSASAGSNADAASIPPATRLVLDRIDRL